MRNLLGKYGLIGIAVMLVYFLSIVCFQWSKIIQIGDLELNEFGDFLAGVVGPIAIFWLILGFFQQGEELRNSIRTLELQAEELRNSVEQQRNLVEVTKEQLAHEAEIFKMQMIREDEERVRREKSEEPFLQFVGGGGSSSGGALTASVSIKNIGRPCRDLEVRFKPENMQNKVIRYPYFDMNHSSSIDYRHDTREEFEGTIYWKCFTVHGVKIEGSVAFHHPANGTPIVVMPSG